ALTRGAGFSVSTTRGQAPRDRGNKTATERCNNPATKRTKPHQWTPRELYVSIVGTVAGARGRGLAAACMARSLGLAAASGEFDTVNLEVDSDSPTGATRLYERLGFTLARTFASMERIPSS
ncbi:GNAT family N-acetyltransferase, partial [Mobilicoccus sp.]|uniref:GNAT family N-acetyltransferase n=1 Tax=Mobilicoccus sp. TaxID=2034349 RepID=UPI00289D52D7